MPLPSPSPRPVPRPVPAPPPVPGPWLGGASGAFASTPSRVSASAGLFTIGAMTGGNALASRGGGGGSGGRGVGRIGGGSWRAGRGLLTFSTPLRMALGGGAFCISPPPPPPPPGPGETRNTMRMGSSLIGSVRSSATARPRLAMNRIDAMATPCRLVETTSGTVVARFARADCPNSSRPRPSSPAMPTAVPARSARTARTASSCAMKSKSSAWPPIGNCAATERISPRPSKSSTRASDTPAASAMSRAV